MNETIQICASESVEQDKSSKSVLMLGAVLNILGAIIIFVSIYLEKTGLVKSVGFIIIGFGWALLAYALIRARQMAKHNIKEGE
ncbi:MAG: hypothetical protein FD163_1268 [Hyphomonadaceae bacterium]|nr:MAG: hypothetical protein FD128_1634 [Hyphomonadaceae bacterium]KAF0185453.1 MAG: hypothetical protein FD163_1268 [Hyphomonadaceae bacterium]